MIVRAASLEDADSVAQLVNSAYDVERFFVGGDRTSVEEVRTLIGREAFLVGIDDAGAVVACVHVETLHGRGSFGMLAIAPALQGRGLGLRLIRAAEDHALASGCATMDIRVVNLRTDLLSYYARLGYLAFGTEAYTHRPVIQPCHFVLMRKVL